VNRFKPLRLSRLPNETLYVSGAVDPSQLFQYEVAGLSMLGPCNGILCFPATLRKDRHWQTYNRTLLWNWTKTLTIIRQIPVFRNLLQLREDGLVVLTTDDEYFVLYDPITQEETF
jgi:hypothetical protein